MVSQQYISKALIKRRAYLAILVIVVDILISCFIDNYTNKTRIMTKNKENKTIIISQYFT